MVSLKQHWRRARKAVTAFFSPPPKTPLFAT